MKTPKFPKRKIPLTNYKKFALFEIRDNVVSPPSDDKEAIAMEKTVERLLKSRANKMVDK